MALGKVRTRHNTTQNEKSTARMGTKNAQPNTSKKWTMGSRVGPDHIFLKKARPDMTKHVTE